jgi:hypothetical protein
MVYSPTTVDRFTHFAAKFHTKTKDAAAAITVDGILDKSLSSGLQSRLEGSDGGVYSTFSALIRGAPSIAFTTSDIKTFMDEMSADMILLVDSDGTHPGIVAYFQQYLAGGTRVALGTVQHESATIATGICFPKGIRVSQDSDMTVSAEVYGTNSAGVNPVAIAITALPTVYPTVVRWGLGKVMLNSTEVGGLQDFSIDFGISPIFDFASSSLYPLQAFIRTIQPTITVTCTQANIIEALTVNGAYYTASQVVLYGKKRAEGGTFVADVTAEHIKFTLNKCRVDWERVAGDPKAVTLRIQPYYTAAGSPVYPITVSTASAIT